MDIDSLNPKTLHKLYHFVMKNTQNVTGAAQNQTLAASGTEAIGTTDHSGGKRQQFASSSNAGELVAVIHKIIQRFLPLLHQLTVFLIVSYCRPWLRGN